MMERAADQTGNDNFGLCYGQQFQPDKLGLIGGIATMAPTLGAELLPFPQQATATSFVGDRHLMQLRYRIPDGSIVNRRQDAELTLGMFVNVFRHCLGADWVPEEIHFEHLKPRNWKQHESAFLAPVYFGQRTNAVVFRNENLYRVLPRGDLRELTRLHNQVVNVSRDGRSVSLIDQVKGEIRNQLPDGSPSIQVIADALTIPRWTLQRRLADYGFTFSDLVDSIRKSLAEHYVKQPYIPLFEVAAILGYSELSAFSRAFSRWFDVSPSQFRHVN
jgi:AraC-like DNA-binding protein